LNQVSNGHNVVDQATALPGHERPFHRIPFCCRQTQLACAKFDQFRLAQAGLFDLLTKHVDNLAAKTGIDRKVILEQSLLTPSCGTGSMEVADAEKVFATLAELSALARVKFGL